MNATLFARYYAKKKKGREEDPDEGEKHRARTSEVNRRFYERKKKEREEDPDEGEKHRARTSEVNRRFYERKKNDMVKKRLMVQRWAVGDDGEDYRGPSPSKDEDYTEDDTTEDDDDYTDEPIGQKTMKPRTMSVIQAGFPNSSILAMTSIEASCKCYLHSHMWLMVSRLSRWWDCEFGSGWCGQTPRKVRWTGKSHRLRLIPNQRSVSAVPSLIPSPCR